MNEIISKKNSLLTKIFFSYAIGAAGGLEMSQSYNL